jgi:hypothetical protein
MSMIYSPDLKAHLSLDNRNKVRHILHTQEYFLSEKSNARLAAIDYLQRMAETFQIPLDQLTNLHQKVSFLDPREQGIEYRLYEIKKFFASATYGYYQTIHNVPVWRGGMTVTVKGGPYRIVHADHYGHEDLKVRLPAKDVIERIRAALIRINSTARSAVVGAAEGGEITRPAAVSFKSAFAGPQSRAAARRTRAQTPPWFNQIRMTRGLFYIYRYEARERQPKHANGGLKDSKKKPFDPEAGHLELTLPLPPVPDQIKDGQHYLVAEIIFNVERSLKDRLNWKALIEVETGSILWLRAMTSGVNGLVFTYDPKTSTGDLTNTPDSSNAVLNPLRDDVVLPNLNAPVMGTQSLSGSHVMVSDDDAPAVPVPTQASGSDFDYDARTNNFAAVNAYYHANNVFDVIEDLGFDLATYFDGTVFPVHVDHRASFGDPGGIEVNAFCGGDAGGAAGDGIGLVGYCLSDDTGVADTTINPLGRSVDKWVHWHEIGGHGILYDHVSSPNFGFAHSAGDSLAAFQNDPESQLRALPQRFQYAPFRNWPPGSDRWFNRAVAAGWGWGGVNDGGGYLSEQVLATTLFRVYQALGGDSNDVAKRWHASRVATYLVLNAVGKLTPGTNPGTPEGLYNKLVEADTDDWTSEGLAGGAYNKVIRWSFEKQNLWAGAPPTVDLYIDDGRGGEYQYQAVHWNNPSVWNRTAADGGTTQDPGVEGVPSFAYVKVKNRGTTNASGVVKVYHCNPGAGLTWPTDFQQADPVAGLPTGTVLANNGNEVIVGPFNWTPNANVYGHDCLLAIVTADGDPSNVSNLEPGQTIQEWRLVPHDNNVGQRNVNLVPGGGGGEALAAAMDGAVFFAGNNFNKPAQMELRVDVPKVLASKGWRLQFAGLADNRFRLKAGEKRRIELKLSKGAEFTAGQIRSAADKTFTVYLYGNGILMGGMSYFVDPDMTEPSHGRGRPGTQCKDVAQELLDCLKLSGDRKVKKVCVKKVSVDIQLDNDCGCD